MSKIENVLSEELQNISKWLVYNKLSLHLGNTESILFGSKYKLSKSSKLNVECNGTQIVAKSTVTYMGSEIDQYMSGEEMVQKLYIQSPPEQILFARKSKYLDRETMKIGIANRLATALVQCHFDYACSSWYTSLTKKTQDKLQVCQNKLIKIILKQAFREFLVSLALISNLNGHKSVELSHVKCKILTYFMMSFICSL